MHGTRRSDWGCPCKCFLPGLTHQAPGGTPSLSCRLIETPTPTPRRQSWDPCFCSAGGAAAGARGCGWAEGESSGSSFHRKSPAVLSLPRSQHPSTWTLSFSVRCTFLSLAQVSEARGDPRQRRSHRSLLFAADELENQSGLDPEGQLGVWTPPLDRSLVCHRGQALPVAKLRSLTCTWR